MFTIKPRRDASEPVPDERVTALLDAAAAPPEPGPAPGEAAAVAAFRAAHQTTPSRSTRAPSSAVRLRLAAAVLSTGVLLTGHAVIRVEDGAAGSMASGTAQTSIRFGAPSPAEIDAYIATGEPMVVAGGFTLDGYGGWFVDGVDGDPSSVIGISLPLTRQLLIEVGVSIVDLWAR